MAYLQLVPTRTLALLGITVKNIKTGFRRALALGGSTLC